MMLTLMRSAPRSLLGTDRSHDWLNSAQPHLIDSLAAGAKALSELSRRLKRAVVFSDTALNSKQLDIIEKNMDGPFDDTAWELCPFPSCEDFNKKEECLNEGTPRVMCLRLNLTKVLTMYDDKQPHYRVVNHMLTDLGYLEYCAGRHMVSGLTHEATGCSIGNIRGKPDPRSKGKADRPTVGLVIHMQGPKKDGTSVTAEDVRDFIVSVNMVIRKRICRAYVVPRLLAYGAAGRHELLFG
jgi:hypothetical protein